MNRIYRFDRINLALDFSKTKFEVNDVQSAMINKSLNHLQSLEAGEKVNVTEERMVGHYWLRNAELSPNDEIKKEIVIAKDQIINFAKKIHNGEIKNQSGEIFENILVVGIGGSALGPQFVAKALKHKAKMKIYFFDNTDPEGFLDVLNEIDCLAKTIVLVISKSGGTPETANGMKVVKYAFEQKGFIFEKSAVAITMPSSKLDNYAKENNWLKRFPLFDWVGGRTSIWSTVGLVPFALLGFNIDQILNGAKESDILGREQIIENNPSLLLASFVYSQTLGKGEKNMVVLPYSDRLELFGKYLQQLIMESLGKEFDLNNKLVNQGITVLGNKGSTDQHSYVQQLRSGLNDFFAIFVKVLELDKSLDIEVEEGVRASDYLNGFFLGTRKALFDNGRESLTISIKKVDEFSLGALIALFERFVSFYASFVNINAYDQPGVEAGKKAAGEYLEISKRIGELRIKNINISNQDIKNQLGLNIDLEDLEYL